MLSFDIVSHSYTHSLHNPTAAARERVVELRPIPSPTTEANFAHGFPSFEAMAEVNPARFSTMMRITDSGMLNSAAISCCQSCRVQAQLLGAVASPSAPHQSWTTYWSLAQQATIPSGNSGCHHL